MASDPRFKLPIRETIPMPSDKPEEPTKATPTKTLTIKIDFSEERDLRQYLRMFLDGVDENIRLLTQDMSVDNKMHGTCEVDWMVGVSYYKNMEGMF